MKISEKIPFLSEVVISEKASNALPTLDKVKSQLLKIAFQESIKQVLTREDREILKKENWERKSQREQRYFQEESCDANKGLYCPVSAATKYYNEVVVPSVRSVCDDRLLLVHLAKIRPHLNFLYSSETLKDWLEDLYLYSLEELQDSVVSIEFFQRYQASGDEKKLLDSLRKMLPIFKAIIQKKMISELISDPDNEIIAHRFSNPITDIPPTDRGRGKHISSFRDVLEVIDTPNAEERLFYYSEKKALLKACRESFSSHDFPFLESISRELAGIDIIIALREMIIPSKINNSSGRGKKVLFSREIVRRVEQLFGDKELFDGQMITNENVYSDPDQTSRTNNILAELSRYASKARVVQEGVSRFTYEDINVIHGLFAELGFEGRFTVSTPTDVEVAFRRIMMVLQGVFDRYNANLLSRTAPLCDNSHFLHIFFSSKKQEGECRSLFQMKVAELDSKLLIHLKSVLESIKEGKNYRLAFQEAVNGNQQTAQDLDLPNDSVAALADDNGSEVDDLMMEEEAEELRRMETQEKLISDDLSSYAKAFSNHIQLVLRRSAFDLLNKSSKTHAPLPYDRSLVKAIDRGLDIYEEMTTNLIHELDEDMLFFFPYLFCGNDVLEMATKDSLFEFHRDGDNRIVRSDKKLGYYVTKAVQSRMNTPLAHSDSIELSNGEIRTERGNIGLIEDGFNRYEKIDSKWPHVIPADTSVIRRVGVKRLFGRFKNSYEAPSSISANKDSNNLETKQDFVPEEYGPVDFVAEEGNYIHSPDKSFIGGFLRKMYAKVTLYHNPQDKKSLLVPSESSLPIEFDGETNAVRNNLQEELPPLSKDYSAEQIEANSASYEAQLVVEQRFNEIVGWMFNWSSQRQSYLRTLSSGLNFLEKDPKKRAGNHEKKHKEIITRNLKAQRSRVYMCFESFLATKTIRLGKDLLDEVDSKLIPFRSMRETLIKENHVRKKYKQLLARQKELQASYEGSLEKKSSTEEQISVAENDLKKESNEDSYNSVRIKGHLPVLKTALIEYSTSVDEKRGELDLITAEVDNIKTEGLPKPVAKEEYKNLGIEITRLEELKKEYLERHEENIEIYEPLKEYLEKTKKDF